MQTMLYSRLYLARVITLLVVTHSYCQLLLRIEGGELVYMNDCMAYGQVTAPSQENPTSASTELDVVYDTI